MTLVIVLPSRISAGALPGLKELPQFPGVPVKKPVFKILEMYQAFIKTGSNERAA